MLICPCCSQATGKVDPVWLGPYIRDLTPQQQIIYDILARSFGRRVSSDLIREVVYSDDPDGGPDDARNVVVVQIYQLRLRLRQHGLTVSMNKFGWYQLRWIEEEKVAA